MIDYLIQIPIIIFSCGANYLFSSKTKYKYGFVVSLMGQPFWIYTTYYHSQWGMFIVSLWFTIQHVRGIKNHW